MMFLFSFFIVLSLVLMFISWLLVNIGVYYGNKLSSFECGFMSYMGSSGAFSLHFFLISIIFLIFDVEIVLILPLPLVFGKISLYSGLVIMIFFIILVLGGLYFEWWLGSLKWVY